MYKKMNNGKEHYRLYKSGKRWISAMVVVGGLVLGLSSVQTVSASEVGTDDASATVVATPADKVDESDTTATPQSAVPETPVDEADTKATLADSETESKSEASKPASTAVTSEGQSASEATTAAALQTRTAAAATTQTTTAATKTTPKTRAGDSDRLVEGTLDEANKKLAGDVLGKLEANKALTKVVVGVVGDAIVDAQASAVGATTGDLKTDGYVIKAKKTGDQTTLVIQASGQTGLMYALQHLNTLVAKKQDLTTVDVHESPDMVIRGVIEGFYGDPWSDQARKDMFAFMAEHKMNTYIYSPKDDSYLRKNWRELYPQEKLNEIKGLVDAARANHVQFVYTLSPGNDITYSSDADYDATIAKFNQLRSIGVTQFYIALDDIPLTMTAADKAKFPNHATPNYSNNPWSGLADAQAFYLNRVQRDYVKANHLPDLWLVPTNYNGSARDPFKEAQGIALDKGIRMQWTGEGVFSATITSGSIERAKDTYHTDHMFIWDNFPVNDSDQHRLYLNPVTGRADDLYKVTDGFTANPMIEPYASWIGIASFGDYMWKASRYNPQESLKATVKEMAGDNVKVQETLNAFVDLNQYWDYAAEKDKVRAPELTALVDKYMTTKDAASRQALVNRLNLIANAPAVLSEMKVHGFYSDSLAWINAASNWAKASLKALDIVNLIHQEKVDEKALGEAIEAVNPLVDQAMIPAIRNNRTDSPDLTIIPSVGDGEFQKLIAQAYAEADAYFNLHQLKTPEVLLKSSGAISNITQYQNNPISNIIDGNLDTKFWSSRNVAANDHIIVQLTKPDDIQRVVIHQGKSDDATSGDIFGKATVYAVTEDEKLVKFGELTANGLVQIDRAEPIKAQAIAIVAEEATAAWLQVREIEIFGSTGQKLENLTAIDGAAASKMFDKKVETSYTAELTDKSKDGVIEQISETPLEGMKSVVLVGQVKGTVFVRVDGEWKKLGEIDGKQTINRLAIKDDKGAMLDKVDGLRFVANSGTETLAIRSFGFSTDEVEEKVEPDKEINKPGNNGSNSGTDQTVKPGDKGSQGSTDGQGTLPKTDGEQGTLPQTGGQDSLAKTGEQGTLPQTGEKSSNGLVALGVAIVGLIAGGLGFRKREN